MEQVEQVISSFIVNPHKNDDFYKWGRTIDVNTNDSFTNYFQLHCELGEREGIVNVVINRGKNPIQTIHTNPETFRPKSNFKNNLFDSHYSKIILFNP